MMSDGSCFTFIGEQFKERHTDDVDADLGVLELGVGDGPVEAALEFADVLLDPSGNKENGVFGEFPADGTRLFAEDGATGLEIGWLDIGDETLEETGAQPFLETGNVRRSGVGGEDHLTTGGLKGVEGVEELFLGPLLPGDELDVVEEQDIDAAEGLTKGLHLLPADAVDEFVDELLGGHVRDLASRVGRDRTRWPMACRRWVFPRPEPP